MDIVWIAALAALWGLAAGMVIGLDRLAGPKRTADATAGARP